MVIPDLHDIVDRLSAHFGPQHWWPAETPFEVMIGAVLTQNTAWGNVEKAISNLKAKKLLNPAALAAIPSEKLQELIKPTGYFRQKERKLRALLEWFNGRYGGSVEALKKQNPTALRRELLGLWGIGPETADSVLCYAVGAPVFVVDAYTVRVLARHGFLEPGADYDTAQALAHSQFPSDTAYLNEAHALFVAAGKHYCKRRLPLCVECPLGSFPHSES